MKTSENYYREEGNPILMHLNIERAGYYSFDGRKKASSRMLAGIETVAPIASRIEKGA